MTGPMFLLFAARDRGAARLLEARMREAHPNEAVVRGLGPEDHEPRVARARVRQLIEESSMVVLLWSESALRSPSVFYELGIALALDRPIFIAPVHGYSGELPPVLHHARMLEDGAIPPSAEVATRLTSTPSPIEATNAHEGFVPESKGPPTDAELMARWRGGDEAAGQRLVGLHIDAIYGFFASRIGGDVATLVEETFLDGKRCHDDDADLEIETLLFRIARRRLYASMEDECARRHKPADPNGTTAVHLWGSSFTWPFGRHPQLRHALQNLAIEPQIVYEMHDLRGFPLSRLAQIMEVSLEEAGRMLQRAKALLRAELRRISDDQEQVERFLGYVSNVTRTNGGMTRDGGGDDDLSRSGQPRR